VIETVAARSPAEFGRPLDLAQVVGHSFAVAFRGRTGFDLMETPEAACRGRCVGLV